jgi:hypothetical protein
MIAPSTALAPERETYRGSAILVIFCASSRNTAAMRGLDGRLRRDW